MDHYVLPTNMRDSLVQYLSQRPYREVAGAINALMNLQMLKTPNVSDTDALPASEAH